jgi:thiol-disulfide isomerase/thioredoxin
METNKKNFFIFVVIVLVLTLSFTGSVQAIAMDLLKPPVLPAPGSIQALGQADYHWTIKDLDGTEMTLSDFKNKVVFLHLWATWCKYCGDELPMIQRLYELLQYEDVGFVIASYENEKILKDFVSKQKLRLPIFRYEGTPPAVFKSGFFPVTYVIDRNGGIVFEHIGSAKWHDLSFVRFLLGLL